MHLLILSVFCVFCAVVARTVTAAGTDLPWPRFRGPNGSGIAEGATPPLAFGPEKNVRWKTATPSGASSPIVARDQVVLTAFDGNKLFTIAYDQKTGTQIWRAPAPAEKIEPFHKTEGSPAASTPCSDGTRIYSYFGSCGLLCYDQSGKELWQYKLPPAKLAGEFGSAVSPIVEDGLVILVRDEVKNARIVALDALTGKPKWETMRNSPTSYSSPLIWGEGGQKEVISAGHARLLAYDLKTGAEKWNFRGIPSAACSSPVLSGGILLYAGGAGTADDKEYQMPNFDSMLKDLDKDGDGALSRAEAEKMFEGFFDNYDTDKNGKLTRDEWDEIVKYITAGKSCAVALRPGGHGDISESHVLWKKTKGLPYIPTAITYRGQFLIVKDGGVVTSYQPATGEQLFQERLGAPGQYYASPVAASGYVYLFALDGTGTILKIGDKTAEALPDHPKLGERVGSTPAIAGDTLYVRTAGHLYAFAQRE